jgi:hypothetical protein
MMGATVAAESLPVALFDELGDRELPALLRARPQAGELPRIHAERARHLDLPSREPAGLLRVRPRLLVREPDACLPCDQPVLSVPSR